MQIKVNVDAIGKTTDEHIESRFGKQGLPKCIGSMIPPIISRQVAFDDLHVLIAKEALSEKEVVVSDLSKVIDADETYYKGKVMSKSGVERIEQYKIDRADKYTEQIIKCSICTYENVCNKLTENYLKVISIQEMIKLQDILKSKREL